MDGDGRAGCQVSDAEKERLCAILTSLSKVDIERLHLAMGDVGFRDECRWPVDDVDRVRNVLLDIKRFCHGKTKR